MTQADITAISASRTLIVVIRFMFVYASKVLAGTCRPRSVDAARRHTGASKLRVAELADSSLTHLPRLCQDLGERLPIVSSPSRSQALRVTFRKARMVEDDLAPCALLHGLELGN
jgi:hypothetical protein